MSLAPRPASHARSSEGRRGWLDNEFETDRCRMSVDTAPNAIKDKKARLGSNLRAA
jgi:hypothetical protein